MVDPDAPLFVFTFPPGRAPVAEPVVKIPPLPMPKGPAVNVPEAPVAPWYDASMTVTPRPLKIASANALGSLLAVTEMAVQQEKNNNDDERSVPKTMAICDGLSLRP